MTGHITNQKAGLEHNSLQHFNTCDAAKLCKTNTSLTLCQAETVKNSCCTPPIPNLNRNKQIFLCFALLIIFTNLILLQSIIKALNCYTWATKWVIKASCSSALSNSSQIPLALCAGAVSAPARNHLQAQKQTANLMYSTALEVQGPSRYLSLGHVSSTTASD